ncbi:class I SAM-dependent methyltransferase [Natrinema sp. 1APR25-10V2]|uniref:class I SAM-dependent methyltransferase n=1 Tax=Natrinema sp. 1APR25-10V2 TaxID=2951081 RepID=UPI002874DEBD|nr:class I SAM-dependent methyltransferase [Natrinema sp. 1APR25-10V2]MDS0476376.1 class I SAM-dependent methyltransferase [Natrinema sp. 1APR25-10V2]
MTNDADRKRDVATAFSAATDGYRDGAVLKEGDDLERLVDWCSDATRALDVATGAGHVAGGLVDAGVSRVVAADLSPEMVRTATTEYPRVEGVAVDAERLPFAANQFDAVTCRFAAHHFPDPEAFLAEVERVLAPGGVFALEDLCVPDDPELAAYVNRLERLRDPGHVETYSSSQWRGWLEAAGLTVDAVQETSRRLEVDAWLDRMDVPADRRREIRASLADAPAALEDAFEFEYETDGDGDGQRLTSYRTGVSLFRATA